MDPARRFICALCVAATRLPERCDLGRYAPGEV
jgi:hypothetical protein